MSITTSPKQEDDSKQKPPYIPMYGGGVGYEQVLSPKARSVFGNAGFSLSPGFGHTFARQGFLLVPGLSILSLSDEVRGETNKAFIVAVGPSYRYGFSKPYLVETVGGKQVLHFKTFSPYVEAGIRLVYSDVSDRTHDNDAKHLSFGSSFTVGTSITKNAFIEAQLKILPTIQSYNFSTFGVDIGVRF